MKKRILALATVSVLLVTAFAACKKEDKNDIPEATPTVAPTASASPNDISNDASKDDTLSLGGELINIPLGGTFLRDDASVSFYIADGTWNVAAYHFTDGSTTAPTILTGTTSLGNGPVFLYADNANELSFTFAQHSLTVAVTKGDDYKVFEGTYPRITQTSSENEVISPERGSSLELLGRIALTHYMVNADGLPECMIDLAATSYDNAYMVKFLLAYTNLFLSSEADLFTEIGEDFIGCSVSKDALNELFLTTSAGTFDVSAFDGSAENIIVKDDMYYIPCNGSFSGGLTVENAEGELISDALSINGTVTKADGTRYDVSMTLATAEDTSSGAAGIRINTANYKLAQ